MADVTRRIRAAYVPVVRDGRLLFKYDPYRHVIEIQDRRVLYVVDLALLDAKEDAATVDGNGAVTSSE